MCFNEKSHSQVKGRVTYHRVSCGVTIPEITLPVGVKHTKNAPCGKEYPL